MNSPQNNGRLAWEILVIIPVIAVGFLMPAPQSRIVGLLIKGVLFAIAVAALVLSQRPGRWTSVLARPREERMRREETIQPLNSEILGKKSWDGFSVAFKQFYVQYLDLIRSAVVASCTGFYLKSANGLILQAGLDSEGEISPKGSIREGGLVSQVADQKKAVLSGQLSPNTVMDGFTETTVQSFLGVPMLWEDELLGVLAIGSDTPDSFGDEDAEYLTRCARLLTETMSSFHRGLRWEADQHIIRIHREIENDLRSAKDDETAMVAFVDQIRKIFPFDRITLSLREGEEGVIRQVFGQIDAHDRGARFSLDEGLNGWVLKRNAPLLIPDMAKGNYARPRYNQGEDTRHGFRCFLGIPLGRGEMAWGCLSLESKQQDQYGEKGKDVLMQLSRYLEVILEQVYTTGRTRGIEVGSNLS